MSDENSTVGPHHETQVLAQLLEMMRQAVWAVDATSGELLYANRSGLSVYGYSLEQWQANTNIWLESVYPDDLHIAEGSGAKLYTDGESHAEYRIIHASGEVRWLQSYSYLVKDRDGAPSFIGGIVADITARKRAEESRNKLQVELERSRRLESIGQLAGGIAHDFNNLLLIIMGHLDMAIEDLPSTSEVRSGLFEAQSAARRASELTSRLLSFSRAQPLKRVHVDLNEVIAGSVRLLERLISTNVKIIINTCDAPLIVHADASYLDQVLINLCVNARDAMPGGGEIRVTTERLIGTDARDARQVHRLSSSGAAAFAVLSVEDTGCGMSPDAQSQIFEPFYTTKPVGSGTGLGLSVVHGVVKQHGGFIDVASEPGVGSTFRVHLPSVDSAKDATHSKTAGALRPVQVTNILLAEDEDGVRRMAARILRRAGYSVIEARDGEEAVRIFEARRAEIGFVILDVVMPKLAGPAAWQQMLNLGADVPVLFSSGYSPELLQQEFAEIGDYHMLPKPYAPSALVSAVEPLLVKQSS